MTDQPERNFLSEAKALIAGDSPYLCELNHLFALVVMTKKVGK